MNPFKRSESITRLNLELNSSKKEIEQRDGSIENPAVPLAWPVELEMDGLFGPTTPSGVRVSELISMQDDTVYACVRTRAETMGQMPMNLLEATKQDGQSALRLADEQDLYTLLHDEPNPFMSSPVFRETMQACLDVFGNAYAVIDRDNANRIKALWPRNPKKVKPWVYQPDNGDDPQLWYMDEDGANKETPEVTWWKAEEMIHLVGLGFDGLVGLSPIKYFMKNAIGLAIASEQYGARFYANNGRPGGVLVYKGAKLDQNTKETIKNSWMEAQAGRNQGRPAVLHGDWDWKEMNVPAEEMQFLQTRRLQAEKICGMFRVPPHKIGILERSTNNNIEHQSIEFIRDCMGPQINKWETEFTRKLCKPPTSGRNAGRKFLVNFDWTDLIQGDFKELVDALSVATLNGTIAVNEARHKLKMNPIGAEGDLHTVQSQLTTLEALGAQAKQAIKNINNPPAAPAAVVPPADAKPEPVNGARYSQVFMDAFNRTLHRADRNFDAIKATFGAVIGTIAGDLNEFAKAELRTTALSSEAINNVVDDQIKAMAKRAADWKTESAAEELDKAVRSIRIAIFRDAAIAKAKNDE